ncbi:MAG: hypothetical protein QHH75_08530 [Bacillota bacterium]|nr:hypothetical protein [Bacillota bacterium]
MLSKIRQLKTYMAPFRGLFIHINLLWAALPAVAVKLHSMVSYLEYESKKDEQDLEAIEIRKTG